MLVGRSSNLLIINSSCTTRNIRERGIEGATALVEYARGMESEAIKHNCFSRLGELKAPESIETIFLSGEVYEFRSQRDMWFCGSHDSAKKYDSDTIVIREVFDLLGTPCQLVLDLSEGDHPDKIRVKLTRFGGNARLSASGSSRGSRLAI